MKIKSFKYPTVGDGNIEVKVYASFKIHGEIFVTHKNHKKKSNWVVSHYLTGLGATIGEYKTRKEAIKAATKRLKYHGKDRLLEVIKRSNVING